MAGQPNKNAKQNKPAVQEGLLDLHGISALIQLGRTADEERKGKNRTIFGLFVLLAVSLTWNVIQTMNQPEPKLLGETPDGRIRPLPLLNDPIFNSKEILAWAEKCVTNVYNLSYVNWETQIANETQCFSDKGREDFVGSLRKIGLLEYLKPEKQGTVYAVPKQPILRKAWLGPEGYYQWIVDVPYRIAVDGKQRGSLEVVMTMRIRRVSLVVREDGLWVDEYVVAPYRGGAGV